MIPPSDNAGKVVCFADSIKSRIETALQTLTDVYSLRLFC